MNKEINVLFLDDEASILNSLKRLFMGESFGIFTTTNPQEALKVIGSEKIKVVLSDHRMPEMKGTDFLKKVKEFYPHTVRILFTGYAEFSAAEDAINVGEVFRFLSKPWDTNELKMTVHQAIKQFDLIKQNKELFEATRVKNEELENLNRKLKNMYEVQKEFTSTVSHELRTPLASIKTAIDLVVKKTVGEINSEQEDVLGRAKKNVDRLKRLIDDILDLTKMESGKMQMNFLMNDMNKLIQEVMETQKDVAKSRGLYLKIDLAPSIPKIPFDSDRMVQVLNNLLGNAMKFTKEGGITIKTQDKSLENHIVVSVIDTGKGISEKDILKLFQKFQQIESAEENEEGGTGLGLAICKEIVERHGGKIWVESLQGHGTTFSFLLPIQERRTTP